MIRLFLLILLISVWAHAPQAHAEDLYFATTRGSGTDADSYRSGCAPGASAIDLRVATKRDLWICRSADMTGAQGAVPLSKTMTDPLSAKSRTDTVTALGTSIKSASTTVPDLLKELLVDTGLIKPGRDGKLKIYLGERTPIYQRTAWVPFEDHGVVADLWNRQKDAAHLLYATLLEPAIALATTLATETFNCSDAAALTCVHTWTEFENTGWAIVSNAAVGSTTLRSDARNDSTLATDKHEITADYVAHSFTGGTFARCGVIGQKDSSATSNYYVLYADLAATGWNLGKRETGTFASLGTSTQDPIPGSDTMKLTMDGSSIAGTVNGSVIIGPVTDPSPITGNTYGGISLVANGSAQSCTLDNHIGADIVAASFGPLRRRVQ